MKNGKLCIGMIGLGSINRAHLAGYQSDEARVQITAVCDTRAEIVQEMALRLGAKAYTDYPEMLADAEVDAVDITLPHNLHFEVACASLKARKHTLVEKPMTPTSEECATLIRLAKEKGMTFTAAENTPFVRAYQRVEEVLKAGTIGEPRLVRTFIYGSEIDRLTNTKLWKGKRDGSNGGAFIDAGPHSTYLIKWLFGEIAELQATQYKIVPVSEVEDNAVMSGRLANGGVFICEYSFTAEIPWGERLEVYGSKGSIIVDQLQNPPARIYRNKGDYESIAIEELKYDPKNWKFESIGMGVVDFVSAVRENRPTRVSPEDAQYGVYVAEKAYESVRAGGRVVKVR